MRKLKKLSLILLASAALLCGCTQSNIVSPSNGVVQGDGQPDLEVDKNINIDWRGGKGRPQGSVPGALRGVC